MALLLWFPLVAALVLAVLAYALRTRRVATWIPVGLSLALLADGLGLLAAVRTSGAISAAAGTLRTDGLSAWMLTTVGAVALVALWGGARRVREHQRDPIAALLCLFLGAMSLALLADNLGLVWVAVEATTITTAFLVGLGGGRRAIEAAWKYVILGSVGVAIAFLGVVLLYAAGRTGGAPTLSWLGLMESATMLDAPLVKVGGALAVVGFATKAGLAPMHSWLPDAHSQAPAPVSGLMSGVLLSVAFYAILRIQAVVDLALGPSLMRTLLLAAGLLSLAVTAALVVTQHDYKRLLAYSSIEHMGLLALGAAAGGRLALAAVLLHVLGHGLVKASMFVISGGILDHVGSHRIEAVRALLRDRPDLGAPFLAGAAALLGFPPFVTFFTEVGIIVAGFQRGLGWQMVVACLLLLVVFAGIARHILAMTVGPASAETPVPSPASPSGQRLWPRQVPVVGALVAAAVVGFLPLAATLSDAVAALGGGR